MIALLGSVLGFLGSFIPDILKYFKAKQDNKHELEVLKLQMEAQKQLHTERLEEINAQADISESKALYESAKIEPTGVKWADAVLALYNGSVRPSITYLFTGLYCTVKMAQVWSMVHVSGTTFLDAVKYTYTDVDMSCLMLVLSYWFGQRMSAKVFKLK
jgi:hypothetical protein